MRILILSIVCLVTSVMLAQYTPPPSSNGCAIGGVAGYTPPPTNCGGTIVWNSITVNALASMNTSTTGTQLTTAIATAGTESPVTTYFWDSAPQGTAAAWTVGAPQSTCKNLGPVAVISGTTHAAGSLNFHSIALLNSGASFNYWNNGPEVAVNKVTKLECWVLNIPQPGDTNAWDLDRIDSVDNALAIINYNSESGSPRVILEVNNNITSGNSVNLTIPGTYWFSLHLDMVTYIASLYVYNSTGTLLGHMTATNAGVVGGDTINVTRTGNSEIGSGASGTNFLQNMMVDTTTAADPLFWTH